MPLILRQMCVVIRSNDHLFILFTYYLCYEINAWIKAVLVRGNCVGKYEINAWIKYELSAWIKYEKMIAHSHNML